MRDLNSERGTVLIMMAVCTLVLIAFLSFIVDHGIMMAARGQAQNAADAGALAGAVTLVGNPADGTLARDTARSVVRANPVWGEALADTDITVSWPLPSRCPNPDNTAFACIKVDVFRGAREGAAQHTNYLPVIFGPLIGVTQQGVVATATAKVMAGNATNCLRPWIIPDGWQELSSPANTTFDVGIDVYTAPGPGVTGTGYTSSMIGQTVTLTAGDAHDAIAPSNYFEGDLGGSGASNYEDNIKGCVGFVKQINELSPPSCPLGKDDPGCMNLSNGRKPQANIDGAQYLINADPYATINTSGVVSGSCAPSCSGFAGRATSPRIVPVALFNPAAYMLGDHQSGNLNLPIVNIMAFFVQSVVSSGKDKGNIIGVLAGDTSMLRGTGSAGTAASFLRVSALVR